MIRQKVPKSYFKSQFSMSKINIGTRKIFLKIPTRNVSSSRIEHNFRNKVVQKFKLKKNVLYKDWSPKLIFLNIFFFEKIPLIFDIEN